MRKEAEHRWYSSWFDTPYYHILYKDRDKQEAQRFMDKLTSFLRLPVKAEILDLACGRGRHSVYLNELGYRVMGVDLSLENIKFARQFENESLLFQQHDMCLPFPKQFDAVFNLFTSFGYFEAEEDNLRTIRSIKSELKKGGYGVIDFLNVAHVKQSFVTKETKEVGGILFHIEKHMDTEHITKRIQFEDDGQHFQFTEKVRALTLSDFESYFDKVEAQLLHCFGDYDLNPFNEENSERLILIFN
ncbi:methyltransferase domain-containing protein [Aureisphaera galaxeae]|uniref:class I SAM-dependent methyltransferase n=1 Tax=Aureisphaera galaxeae TaxID=1538023 RepID=UPI00234FBE20|nr:class I SAM-dependent methyltransferase [Aureisphaera galaxeae]MDC8004412.1 methyltransferase domain-containing protein [Aureisphaera galaxeae]